MNAVVGAEPDKDLHFLYEGHDNFAALPAFAVIPAQVQRDALESFFFLTLIGLCRACSSSIPVSAIVSMLYVRGCLCVGLAGTASVWS